MVANEDKLCNKCEHLEKKTKVRFYCNYFDEELRQDDFAVDMCSDFKDRLTPIKWK